MDSDGFKKIAVSLLLSGLLSAYPCSVNLPPSCIDLQDAAYSAELDIHFHLCALAKHYFPDCVPVKPRAAEEGRADSGNGETPEERLFKDGREALRRNPEERFPESWKQLLALPERERRRRTAQTLYLLGNLHAQDNPRKAYEWYQKLRSAVNGGMPDPMNLAEKSFRTNYFYAKDPVERLRHLVLAACYGKCTEAEEGSETPRKVCSFRRELWSELGAMIRKHPRTFLTDPLTAEVAALFRPDLIRQLHGPFVCGDLLALRAFERGDWESCARLLAGTQENSPIRLYLEARFARRKGDYRKSAELLRKWLELYRDGMRRNSSGEFAVRSVIFTKTGCSLSAHPEWCGIYWPEIYAPDPMTARGMQEVVRGQLGALQYRNELFPEALYSFLMGNAWSDAALIAEEHLSSAELRKFADAHEDNPQIPPLMTAKLRHLLARRLMRENRFSEAGKYFPPALREVHGVFAETAAEAENASLEQERRAAAYFRLGQIMLRHDIALFGYELAPDYFICEGEYDSYPIRQNSGNTALPRFHYRLREAEYFRRAGEASRTPELRFLSYLAGGYVLRNRMPEQAEPFYRSLVRERFLPYSPGLDRFRWIPAPPADWKAVIASCDAADRGDVRRRIDRLLSLPGASVQKVSGR